MSSTAFFAARYHEEPSEALLRRIFKDAASPYLEDIRPFTSEDYDRFVRILTERDFRASVPGFDFVRVTQEGRITVRRRIRVNVSLRENGNWWLGPRRKLQLKAFQGGPGNWLSVMAGPTGLDPSSSENAAWFFERVRPFIPMLEPSYGFADVMERVIARIGDDASQVAWPLMIFGPEEVEKFGRERLLQAPAWKVEPLPYGGIWLQVSENPFAKPARAAVKDLAAYLGLRA